MRPYSRTATDLLLSLPYCNYLLCILDIGSCPTDGLTIVPQTQRQLTHNNYDEQFDFLDPILVGSTANIYCQSTNLRITQDKWDEHSTDYNLTVLCKPDKTFLLPESGPELDLPDCLAWCPSEKPIPPNDTGTLFAKCFHTLASLKNKRV